MLVAEVRFRSRGNASFEVLTNGLEDDVWKEGFRTREDLDEDPSLAE